MHHLRWQTVRWTRGHQKPELKIAMSDSLMDRPRAVLIHTDDGGARRSARTCTRVHCGGSDRSQSRAQRGAGTFGSPHLRASPSRALANTNTSCPATWSSPQLGDANWAAQDTDGESRWMPERAQRAAPRQFKL